MMIQSCFKHSALNFEGLLSQGDVDKDGYLDFNEFITMSIHIRKMGNDKHLKNAFAFFDQNKSGYIEIEELRNALADEFDTTSEEIVETIIRDVDTNKVSPIIRIILKGLNCA